MSLTVTITLQRIGKFNVVMSMFVLNNNLAALKMFGRIMKSLPFGWQCGSNGPQSSGHPEERLISAARARALISRGLEHVRKPKCPRSSEILP